MWPARLFVLSGGKSRLQAGLAVLGLSACVVLSGCPDATVNNPPPQTVVYQPQPVYQANPAYQRQPVYQANPAYQSHATYQPNPAYQPQPGYQPQPNPPQGAAPTGTAAAPELPVAAQQLEPLVAPIALYPDPLLAVVLPASTYPDAVQDAS
ncbi:MAG TPA: DUF3300 domain-containing protein, partial [Humisphaera sp.]|nr:DUF3300 domain-containing protein [Humisphaera sp.]